MGEAKRRGTYEERKSKAEPKNKSNKIKYMQSSTLLHTAVWNLFNQQIQCKKLPTKK